MKDGGPAFPLDRARRPVSEFKPKPCPFCGFNYIKVHPYRDKEGKFSKYVDNEAVECMTCGAYVKSSYNWQDDDCLDIWEKRFFSPAPDALRDALIKAREFIDEGGHFRSHEGDPNHPWNTRCNLCNVIRVIDAALRSGDGGNV